MCWHLPIFSRGMPEPESKCGHLIHYPLILNDLCNDCLYIPASRQYVSLIRPYILQLKLYMPSSSTLQCQTKGHCLIADPIV